jgi:hypothetical protein
LETEASKLLVKTVIEIDTLEFGALFLPDFLASHYVLAEPVE